MLVARLTLVLVLAAALLAACGGSDDGNGDPVAGVWRGDQVQQGTSLELCFTMSESDPNTTPEPGGGDLRSGAGYLGEDFLGIAATTLLPDSEVSILTTQYTYTGTVEGETMSGTWGATGEGEQPVVGEWTVERTNDDGCVSEE